MVNNLVFLGNYIKECDERNNDIKYGIKDVRGISILKKIIPTKADMKEVSLAPYKLLLPREFCYITVTSRNGNKISLAINDTNKTYIFSSSYIIFKSKNTEILLPEYLFLLLNRIEFDRYARFNSWGSARETFDWSELCRIKIPLPSIKVQQELVAVYNGLKDLAEQNEALIKPLSDACHASVVDCKKKYKTVKLGEYIEEINIRNTDAKLGGDRLYGINSDGSFISSIANQEKLDLTKYKIVQKYDFCYTLRIIIGSIALYMAEKPCIVSTSYPVFRIKYDKRKMLNAEFLNIIFRRKEFHRYAKVNSWGSAKDNFSLEDLFNYKIPLPPKEVQESIVNLYRCLESAKQIAQKAREEMKTICPALVQRAKEIN